ncbi:MAG TPA: gamma-glutamylcyclotransferase family protein [Rhizomicrobium sp.]|nr:gamma-glutamylcyclotransferase family protein [Rhizomicrobium sp.]
MWKLIARLIAHRSGAQWTQHLNRAIDGADTRYCMGGDLSVLFYFAYGSNMLSARLNARCPSARAIGVAVARDHRLCCWKRSRDSSGKATLVHAPAHDSYGVLFEVDEGDIVHLDIAEGTDYERLEDFMVLTHPELRFSRAITYIALPYAIDNKLCPYNWYKELILAGASEHNLPASYIMELCLIKALPDPWLDRPARNEALRLLAEFHIGA